LTLDETSNVLSFAISLFGCLPPPHRSILDTATVPISVSGAAPRVRPNHSGAEIGGPESKIGRAEELGALQRLDDQARQLERQAAGPTVQELIAQEQRFPSYGGRSVFGWEHGQTSAKIGHIGDR
jgi:hypothetical protein